MKLWVIAVGKLRDRELETRCDEYVKRSRKALAFSRSASRDNAAALAKARELGGRVVLLDERGGQLSSGDLAAWLSQLREQGVKDVAFVVGDAHGFDDVARASADRVLSLSAMTLPHQLAQLVLCEQLYRAGTILSGHPYHHG